MAQFGVPTSDQATGSWVTTPLWSKVDEGVAGDDGTVITLASGNANNNADFKITSSLQDPVSATGHILRVDWGKTTGARTINLFLELWEGVPGTGTLRATLSTTDPVSNTDYAYTLSAAEANSISDYTNLYLRVYYTYTGGGGPSACEVDAVEFEIPDAPSDRTARVSAYEFEVPTAPRRARVSAFEFEVPNAPRRAQVSAFEFEVPTAPRRAQVSAYEFEVPTAPRRAQVSAFELEVPDAPRRAQVSAFEFEVPTAPRTGQVSAFEFEAPLAPRAARVSAFELQVPDAGAPPASNVPSRTGISIALGIGV